LGVLDPSVLECKKRRGNLAWRTVSALGAAIDRGY